LAQDLFSPAVSPSNGRHVYTVSQLTQDIKLILENTFAEVWVEGEISNFSAYSSGHFYFSLKDEAAVLSAVMFSRANKDVKFKIENGLKVICFGKVSVYGPRGQYQVIVERIEPKGIGGLQLALEQLKKKLEKEGLFAEERKRPIPYLPATVGVVTSLSGAAIRDILKVLDRRFSDLRVIIRPCLVQGEGAKDDIASGIKDLNALNERNSASGRIEVMIVGRGGGSIEDLWAFNEEVVARAIYSSKIPVISAVGHERDFTIADLVADKRAATPSVAAELVVPRKEDLQERLTPLVGDLQRAFLGMHSDLAQTRQALLQRLVLTAGHLVELNERTFESAHKKLMLLNPVSRLEQYRQDVENARKQIVVRMGHLLALKDAGFKGTLEKLAGLSPLNILARGYSITFKLPEESILKDTAVIKRGDLLRTRLHRGEIISQVTEV